MVDELKIAEVTVTDMLALFNEEKNPEVALFRAMICLHGFVELIRAVEKALAVSRQRSKPFESQLRMLIEDGFEISAEKSMHSAECVSQYLLDAYHLFVTGGFPLGDTWEDIVVNGFDILMDVALVSVGEAGSRVLMRDYAEMAGGSSCLLGINIRQKFPGALHRHSIETRYCAARKLLEVQLRALWDGLSTLERDFIRVSLRVSADGIAAGAAGTRGEVKGDELYVEVPTPILSDYDEIIEAVGDERVLILAIHKACSQHRRF